MKYVPFGGVEMDPWWYWWFRTQSHKRIDLSLGFSLGLPVANTNTSDAAHKEFQICQTHWPLTAPNHLKFDGLGQGMLDPRNGNGKCSLPFPFRSRAQARKVGPPMSGKRQLLPYVLTCCRCINPKRFLHCLFVDLGANMVSKSMFLERKLDAIFMFCFYFVVVFLFGCILFTKHTYSHIENSKSARGHF